MEEYGTSDSDMTSQLTRIKARDFDAIIIYSSDPAGALVYKQAREMGIKFVKGRPTEITRDPKNGTLIVDVEDITENRFLELDTDLVVLAPAMVPAADTKKIAEILDIELEPDGFYKEYNAKLRPTETKKRGVFICGGATFPKDAPSTSLQAHSASLKAAKFLNSGKIVKDQRTKNIERNIVKDQRSRPSKKNTVNDQRSKLGKKSIKRNIVKNQRTKKNEENTKKKTQMKIIKIRSTELS